MLFTFTATKPPLDQLWGTLVNEPTFDTLPEPLTARTIVFALFASTTNFNSTKDEINKYIEGKSKFSVIEQGFLQSVASKYGINLNIGAPAPIEYADQMETPDTALTAPYITMKQMFDYTMNITNSTDFMASIFGTTPDAFNTDIWGDLMINHYTIQRRFSDYLAGDNFRKFFPAKLDNNACKTINVKDEDELKSRLQSFFLQNFVDNDSTQLQMNYHFQQGDSDAPF